MKRLLFLVGAEAILLQPKKQEKFYTSKVLTILRPTIETEQKAVNIAERYGYVYYDSQVIASALENGCDMQHGQTIEERLTIVNPFLISKQ